MKKGLTELVFILDRSGSMRGLEADTIGGFNSMIARQKEGSTLVTTVLFNTRFATIHDSVPIDEIAELTEDDYFPRGSTALLDAVGKTIGNIMDKQHEQKASQRPEKTIVVIITDGYENASRLYDYNMIKDLVQKQSDLGWEFLFLGAKIDAFAEGRRLGIRRNRSCKIIADDEGTRRAYEDVGKFIAKAKEYDCTDDIDDDWCMSSKEYFESK